MAGRARQYLFGVGTSFVHVAVTTVCNLWLARYLLSHVGEQAYGVWLVLGQLLLLTELVDLGVVALLPREVAYATGSATTDDQRVANVARLLAAAWRLVLRQLPLAAALAAAFWWLTTPAGAGWPAAVVAALCVAFFPLRVLAATLQGLQDLGALGWIHLSTWLLQFVLTVALVYAGWGLWALVLGWAGGRLAAFGLQWGRLRRAFPWARFGSGDGDARGLFARGFYVTVGRLSHSLVSGSEVLLLGNLLSPAAVVVYACTSKLIGLFGVQAYTLALSAEPALSELSQEASPERLRRVLTSMWRVMMLASGGIACLVFLTNEGFVVWWVGAERYGGLAMTLLLAGSMLVRHFSFTLAHTLYCCGHENVLAWLALADGVVTVVLTGLLVYLLGPAGAPAGLLAGGWR